MSAQYKGRAYVMEKKNIQLNVNSGENLRKVVSFWRLSLAVTLQDYECINVQGNEAMWEFRVWHHVEKDSEPL